MKTYLEPVILRRGQPIIHFIDHDKMGFWLGTYYQLATLRTPILEGLSNRKYAGVGNEYNGVVRTRISGDLYRALLKESKANRAIFK